MHSINVFRMELLYIFSIASLLLLSFALRAASVVNDMIRTFVIFVILQNVWPQIDGTKSDGRDIQDYGDQLRGTHSNKDPTPTLATLSCVVEKPANES